MRRSVLVLAALAAGCAQSPTTAPPAPELPVTWQAAPFEGQAPDWAGLLDPQLAALQAQALQANGDIAQAALRVLQAQRQVALSGIRLSPTAGLNASASRPLEQQSSSRTVEVGGISVPVSTEVGWSRSYGASASVGYELDLWNRLAHTTAAQLAQLESARSDVAAAQQLIRTRVAESYWSLAAIAQQEPLARAQLAINRETLQLITLRVREGKLLPIEIDKAAAAVQQALVRVADLAADAQIQRNTLALLLNQTPPGAAVPDPQLPTQSPPNWTPEPPATVLARRPDVQRARAQVDAALARSRAAQAERYPRLSFSASLSTGGSQAADWLKSPVANLAANLAVPLIDWRRLDLQRDNAHTELELAALALRDTVHKALTDVETQLIDAERLQQQLAANALRLQEATTTERLAALRLEVGTIARADFLQAQSARLEAEQGRIQLRLKAWLNRAGLAKALGG